MRESCRSTGCSSTTLGNESPLFSELVDDQLVEKRRGLGMYVAEGARTALLHSERERFLREEWPPLRERLERMGLDLKTLLSQPKNGASS